MRIFRNNLSRGVVLFLLASAVGIPRGTAAHHARQPAADQGPRFQILRQTVLPGDDPPTSLAFDSVSRRLYVGRSSRITVLDADSGRVVGQVPNTGEIGSLLLIPEFGRGFASTSSNTLIAFDLSSLHKTADLAITGKAPNHLAYDPSTKRIFVMNNRSQSVVAVSIEHSTVLKTIDLVDNPDAAVADAGGHLYVVLSDPAEIAVIDTSRLILLQRIQLSPCIEPRGIRMDLHARRLFVGCSNGLLAVADPDLGRLVVRLLVEPNSANVSFDSGSNLLFLSNPAGVISIVSQRFPDRYRVLSSIPTGRPIADLVVDSAQHHLLVAATPSRPGSSSRTPKSPQCIILTIGKIHD